MLSKNIKYLVGVDHLRAVAALLVIFYHGTQLINADIVHGGPFVPEADYVATNWNVFKAFLSEGHFGVALFMTLSGFIFTVGLYGKHVDFKGFFRNRFVRIYPLYIFLIILSVYLYPPADALRTLSLSLLPFSNLVPGFSPGIIGSTATFWTIAVEVQFYLIFPFLIRFLNDKRFRLLFGLVGFVIILRLIALVAGDVKMSDFGYATIFGRLDQFIFGMLAAYGYLTYGKLLKAKAVKLLVASGIALVIFAYSTNLIRSHFGFDAYDKLYVILPTIEALISAAIIISFVYIAQSFNRDRTTVKLFAKLGELSYSLYLTHFMILTVLLHRVSFPDLFGDSWLSALFFTTVVLLPLAIGFSLLTYNLIEKPFLDMRKKYVLRKNASTKETQQAI